MTLRCKAYFTQCFIYKKIKEQEINTMPMVPGPRHQLKLQLNLQTQTLSTGTSEQNTVLHNKY